MTAGFSREDLFVTFERRPDRCRAVHVDEDNIDLLARHYALQGYATDVVRDPLVEGAVLTLKGTTIDSEAFTVRVVVGQCLVYGHPPTVAEDPEAFQRAWRPEPKAQT